MNRILIITMIFALFLAAGCATKKYIEIKHPDMLFHNGKPLYPVRTGDKLEIFEVFNCQGGKTGRTCYRVRNVRTGDTGYVPKERMQTSHHIYSEE